MSFMGAAASYGDAVAVQGDHRCGGDEAMRRWGSDLDRIESRIDAAFRAASMDVPGEAALVGYSQGADRAERLAGKSPQRFTRVVLISSPVVASPQRLKGAKAVAIGVGELEGRASTLESFRRLKKAGVATAWFLLPKARHGEMGPDAQRVMASVLKWLEHPEGDGDEVVRTSER